MKNKRLIIALVLFALGIIGIFSMLTIEIPLEPNVKELLEAQFTKTQIKFLLLINPTLLLIISISAGVFIYDKLNFKLPVIDRIIFRKQLPNMLNILKYAIIGGIVAGILMILIAKSYQSFLPDELSELGKDVNPGILVRLLYGGITEEILMRFGLMTFIVWLISLILRNNNMVVYWLGIILSAFIFGLGHFPIVFQSLENPSFLLLSYIVVGNSVGGIIFGWLYWKKGLESAFIAHIVTHITMITGGYLMSLL